jgi:formate dehydrogenase subunit delta
MDIDNLVRMANRIGDFFQAMPDRDEALGGIAAHIRRFWEPRMRHRLAQALATPESAPLHPLVREALERHPEALA